MSLETVEKKLLSIGKMPSWKFFTIFSLFPGIVMFTVYQLIFQDVSSSSTTSEMRILGLIIFSMLGMVITFFTFIASIALVRFLLKFNYKVAYRHGQYTGRSLATNHEFLRNLAEALYKHLIGFIKSYNDPRFEELEAKHQRENNELMLRIEKLEENDERKERIIARQNQKIFQLDWENKKLQRKTKEDNELLNDRTLTQNSTENTNTKKFKDIDE